MTDYTVYTQAGRKCPHCRNAVELLYDKGLSFSIRPLDRDELLAVAGKAGMTTVPIIYHHDELIGGFKELSDRLGS